MGDTTGKKKAVKKTKGGGAKAADRKDGKKDVGTVMTGTIISTKRIEELKTFLIKEIDNINKTIRDGSGDYIRFTYQGFDMWVIVDEVHKKFQVDEERGRIHLKTLVWFYIANGPKWMPRTDTNGRRKAKIDNLKGDAKKEFQDALNFFGMKKDDKPDSPAELNISRLVSAMPFLAASGRITLTNIGLLRPAAGLTLEITFTDKTGGRFSIDFANPVFCSPEGYCLIPKECPTLKKIWLTWAVAYNVVINRKNPGREFDFNLQSQKDNNALMGSKTRNSMASDSKAFDGILEDNKVDPSAYAEKAEEMVKDNKWEEVEVLDAASTEVVVDATAAANKFLIGDL